VLSVMGGLFNFSGGGKTNNKMPNVIGQMQETATTVLTGLNLKVKTAQEENEAVAGTVIKQSIKEGSSIKKDDTVTLTISKGKTAQESPNTEYIDVPALSGKTFEEAKQILANLGLGIVKADDAFSNEDIGTVISQSPLKGAKLRKEDVVTVTISKGPETTEHVITVTAGKGGTISPKGIVNVADGEDQNFTFTADDGFEIREVKVDGTSIGTPTSYQFTKVGDDHTLYVVFAKKGAVSPSPSPSPAATPSPSPTKPASGTDIIG